MIMTDSLKQVNEIFNRTNKELDTIKDLLEKGDMIIEGGRLKQNGNIELETIYDIDSTVSIGKFLKQGNIMKSHVHDNIVEYLICIKGSFGITLPYGYRILKIKDCASIPEGCLHSTTALEDISMIIAICVPAEKSYKESMKKCNNRGE